MKNIILILFLLTTSAYAEDFQPHLKLEILKNAKLLRTKKFPVAAVTEENKTLKKLAPLKTSDSGNVGNGGGTIVCNDRRFSLDYQIANDNNYNIVSSNLSSEKMALILVKLETLFPEKNITKRFETYIKTLFDSKLWLEFYYETNTAINETKLYCGQTAKQSVWRFTKADGVFFFYNPEQLSELAENTDQMAWILTHEWIWDLLGLDSSTRIDLIEKNISLNIYFHSESFLGSESSEEAKSELLNYGLSSDLFENVPAEAAPLTTPEPIE